MIPFHASQFSGRGGHYESWFLRGNHPRAAQAFWVRYTMFVPADKRPALGELWAIWFDAERKQVVAVKEEYPLEACHFNRDDLGVSLPGASLSHQALQGSAAHAGHHLAWQLHYTEGNDSLLLLPEKLYRTALPKAKALVSRPNVQFTGTFTVDGETFEINGWPGSENHNWGRQHTDEYAWGQVAGFDDHPDAFLECLTARVRLGPFRSPWMTIACLRLGGETLYFNRISTTLRATGNYRYFEWHFDTTQDHHQLSVNIQAPPDHFTALTYYNPPGSSKTCLNSKLASCELTLTRRGQAPITLHSAHRAAFEILTDKTDHGIALAV